MRVDDVPRRIVKRQTIDVADGEFDSRMLISCGVDDAGRSVDAENAAPAEALREISGDRPWPAANVEQLQSRFQMRQQIRRGVLDGSPFVGSEDALVVAVGVHSALVERAFAGTSGSL